MTKQELMAAIALLPFGLFIVYTGALINGF